MNKKNLEPEKVIDDKKIEPVSDPCCHVVEVGDTYASLGKKYAAAGQTGFEKAKQILDLNAGKNLIVGDSIRIS